MVVVLTVVGSIASEKVALGVIEVATPVAPLAGLVPVTVGGVVSARGRRERPGRVGGQGVAGEVLDPG